jgi:hypothetical protein
MQFEIATPRGRRRDAAATPLQRRRHCGRPFATRCVDGGGGELTPSPINLHAEMSMNEIRTLAIPEWQAPPELLNPFREAIPERESASPAAMGFASWHEGATPFAEAAAGMPSQSEADRLYFEALAELRDESFDEAVAFLAEETEQAVADRFTGESPTSGPERERYADSYLSPVRFEAEQYLDALYEGLQGMDLESLGEQQLGEVLDRFDPKGSDLSPAGEEFVGKLVRKAKKAVKFVAGAAKSLGKVAGVVIGPILKRLRKLVGPLLRRVLSFAIGRLPAALQPAARTLASRIKFEAGDHEEEGAASPANFTDVEALAESFDETIAQAIAFDPSGEAADEAIAGEDSESVETRELESLAMARGVLIDRIRGASDEEDLTPAIEQFVPAVLGALRLGIKLVGRPKVVSFLSNYVGQLIKRWVGPQLSSPLANAIVDTGLRLATLEAESGASPDTRIDEAAPVALASVVEDTVRRLAEQEDYVMDNEELMQLATAEAFSQAVSTHFPGQLLRADLQQAPSLGGTFVARKPRGIRTYRKYSRVPEIEITPQMADTLPSFGGTSVGATLRAANATLPMRARVHIYQAAAGTTLPSTLRLDRAGRGMVGSQNAHPLTPAAAGLLLREPKLGVAVPPAYLQSRNRIAAGQRFYVLEPVGAAGLVPAGPRNRAVTARVAPSKASVSVNPQRSQVNVGFYLSEVEAQAIAAAIRQGRGAPAFLQALTGAYRDLERLPHTGGEWLRRRLRAWVLPALADWVKANGEAFVRAAAHPEPGVTVRLRLNSVPGLAACCSACGSVAAAAAGATRAAPPVAITVQPGRAQ